MTSDGPRFAFVLGTGRCGSSLIHEILAKHPDVGFLSNLEDRLSAPAIAGRWNGPLFRAIPPSFSAKGRLRFAPSEGYRILERRVSPAVCTPVRDLTEEDATPWLSRRFRGFFEERARAQGTPVFLHKFTGWPRARFIREALGDVTFVHVVRDGRAVASSLVQMPWWHGYGGPEAWGWGRLPEPLEKAWERTGRSFPVLAALEWKLLMDAFETARSAIPEARWHQIRYEDFLADARGSTEGLLQTIGVGWNASFERSFLRYRFDVSRADAFRRDLSEADLDAIEEIVGDDLTRYGYDLGEDRP